MKNFRQYLEEAASTKTQLKTGDKEVMTYHQHGKDEHRVHTSPLRDGSLQHVIFDVDPKDRLKTISRVYGPDEVPENIAHARVLDDHKASAKNHIKKMLDELAIRNAAGKKIVVSKVPVRMADGTVKKTAPGKSGSSGGGD